MNPFAAMMSEIEIPQWSGPYRIVKTEWAEDEGEEESKPAKRKGHIEFGLREMSRMERGDEFERAKMGFSRHSIDVAVARKLIAFVRTVGRANVYVKL